jgi:hypothetical protein
MPTNAASIFGGIFRGLTNNTVSQGTNPQVPTQQNNPNVYRWIGQSTQDLRQPVSKEATQNPALPWGTGSSGTLIPYGQNVPLGTDIQQGAPDPSIAFDPYASQIGSTIQPIPKVIPVANNNLGNTEMMPQNGSHFKDHFVNQMGSYNLIGDPNAANVLTAVQAQANTHADGSPDIWQNAYQVFNSMAKGYNPSQQYWQGLKQS